MASDFTLRLDLQNGYAFTVQFDQPEVDDLLTDEPPPLGEGRGPNPARLLGAAVGNCLAASLLFCLRKARIEVAGLRATVRGSMTRNEDKRLRIAGLRVRLEPETVRPEDQDRMGRCFDVFEDFCIVTESVRHGIPVEVQVVTPAPAP